MNNYVGGATLNPDSDLSVADNFLPIVEMLQAGSSLLEEFIYSSLKGFMFKLTISDEDSVYKMNTIHDPRLRTPVTEYILKFVVISSTDTERLPLYVGLDSHGVDRPYKKMTESKESFFNEAKMQMSIWRESLKGGYSPICPSVANFAIFENEDSKRLLWYLKSKTVSPVLQYLEDRIDSNPIYQLGVLTMPSFTDSRTCGQIIDGPYSPIEQRTTYVLMASQMLRLFIKFKVLHEDLHLNNALMSNRFDECILIDFGRASEFQRNTNADEFCNKSEKRKMLSDSNTYFDELLLISTKNNDIKRKFISDVLTRIVLSYEKPTLSRWVGEEFSQMEGWVGAIFDIARSDPSILVDICNDLYRKSATLGTGHLSLDHTRVLDFYRMSDVDLFISPFPPLPRIAERARARAEEARSESKPPTPMETRSRRKGKGRRTRRRRQINKRKTRKH